MTLEMQSVQPTSRKRKRGFTLTEIAIVLGIIGLILGAIWVAAGAVYNNLRISKANTATLQLVQGVRGLYATSSTTGVAAATDLTTSLISAKVVPSDLVNAAGTALTNQWPGGATAVLTPATADSFTVEMTAVPQNACIALIMAVGGTGRDPGLFNASSVATAAVAAGDALATAVPLTTAATINPAGGVTSSGATQCGAVGNYKVKFGFNLK